MKGQRYDKAVVIGRGKPTPSGNAMLYMKCDCGYIFPARKSRVLRGVITGCFKCVQIAKAAA